MLRTVFRNPLAALLTAALLAGAAAAPSSAPASSTAVQAETMGCDPNVDQCSTHWRFYHDPEKTILVGGATLDCDNVYTHDWGTATQHTKIHYLYCPY